MSNTPGYDNDLGDPSYYHDAYQRQASHGHNEKASDMEVEFLGITDSDILKDLAVRFPTPRFGREVMSTPTPLGEMDQPGKPTAQGNEGAVSFLNIIHDSDVEKKLYELFEKNVRCKVRLTLKGELNQKTKKGWTYFDMWFEVDSREKNIAEGTPVQIEGTAHWAYAVPNDKV